MSRAGNVNQAADTDAQHRRLMGGTLRCATLFLSLVLGATEGRCAM